MPDSAAHVSPHVCPYAAALSDDEESSHESPHNAFSSTESAFMLARSKCPAFAENSCPFRGATTPESLRSIMKTVPPSHFPSSSPALQAVMNGRHEGNDANKATPFQLAMEHVHRVSMWLGCQESVFNSKSPNDAGTSQAPPDSHTNKEAFIIQGGCPFKSFHREHSSSSAAPLARAMEEYSLAAIMGRMADSADGIEDEANELSQSEEGEDDKDDASKTAEPSNKGETSDQNDMPGQDETHTPKRRSRLSQALKSGTAESHTAAENVHFVKNFIRGVIDRELYMELVKALYHIYNKMEKLLDVHGPKHFPSLHFPMELSRTEALKEDMEFWFGSDWENRFECSAPSPAVNDYIGRMEEAARIDPLLLLSHAYTRYLGDLSGGKVLSRIARRALDLSGHDGLQFYHFDSISSAKLFKDHYRAALDQLPLEPDQIGRLVAEANVAFALNMRVFEELDVAGGVPGATVRNVKEALVYYDREIEKQNDTKQQRKSLVGKESLDHFTEGGTSEGKCPFAFIGGPNPHKPAVSNNTTGGGLKEEDFMAAKKETQLKKDFSVGRCPWPFVFFHDPMTGAKDWQTWIVVGLALCWCWSNLIGSTTV